MIALQIFGLFFVTAAFISAVMISISATIMAVWDFRDKDYRSGLLLSIVAGVFLFVGVAGASLLELLYP